MSVASKTSLTRVVYVCSKIIGYSQADMQQMYEERVLKKAQSLLAEEDHPLHKQLKLFPSGSLFRLPLIKTDSKDPL